MRYKLRLHTYKDQRATGGQFGGIIFCFEIASYNIVWAIFKFKVGAVDVGAFILEHFEGKSDTQLGKYKVWQ